MTCDESQFPLEDLRVKQEHGEHALWQPGGFHSTLKILVISGSQTLRLYGPDMKFSILSCGAQRQCATSMTWRVGCSGLS